MITAVQKGTNPGVGSRILPIPRGNRYDSTQTRKEKTNKIRLLIRSRCSITEPFYVQPKIDGSATEASYLSIYLDDFLRDHQISTSQCSFSDVYFSNMPNSLTVLKTTSYSRLKSCRLCGESRK